MTDALEYTIVLEEAQDGGWRALAPDLPGLLIAGDTREELLASALQPTSKRCAISDTRFRNLDYGLLRFARSRG
jgi:hypothetical protein